MSLTRASTEFLVVPRVGPAMTAAGMDGVTVDGTNVDLNGPIGKAVRYLGHTVASAVLVADADVAQVTDDQLDQFLDLTTLYTLEAVLGNLDDVELRVGPRTEKFNQLAEQLERKIKRMTKQLEKEYGFGLSVLVPGYITLNIAEHDA